MKKLFILTLVLALTLAGFASAAKPTQTCATIQDGTIYSGDGTFLTTGYDMWGYNYQANIFNGWYDNYARPETPVTSGDWLMMKWNNAWLSSLDCDGDHLLDRHYGYPSYIGSGAWLTNHASGTYEGSDWIFSSLTGQYVISFVLGGTYNHDLFLTNTAGVLTGNGGYEAGSLTYSYTWDITSGTVSGDTISFDAVYTGGPDAVGTIMHVTGTIQPDGSVSGTWNDNYLGGYREGTWYANGMTVKETCYWTDFVKIVAVPEGYSIVDDAVNCPGSLGLDNKMWYNPEGVELGCSIWGQFALIQEVYSDPCGELEYVRTYHSPLKSGLGNW